MFVARQLGHADTRMCERHYGHIARQALSASIEKLSPKLGLFESPAEPKPTAERKGMKGQKQGNAIVEGPWRIRQGPALVESAQSACDLLGGEAGVSTRAGGCLQVDGPPGLLGVAEGIQLGAQDGFELRQTPLQAQPVEVDR